MNAAKLGGIVLAGLLAVGLAGCGQAGASTSGSTSGPQKVSSIGVSNLGLSYPFPAAISAGIKEAAAAKGVTVTELDAQGKADKQAADVQDLIGQKPDGVIILPVDGGVAQGLVDQLKKAKIPTVAAASQVGDPKTRKIEDVYPGLIALVTQNEVKTGLTAGEAALKILPDGGKVAIIEGASGFAENTLRVQDFTKPATAAGKTLTIVAQQPGDWVPDKAQSACQNILVSNPDVQLFYALSDDMAVGCSKAVKAAGKTIPIIGVGGSKLGIDAVKTGDVAVTVCYKPKDLGEITFNTLYAYLTTGQTPNPRFISYNTPAITKDNVSDCDPQW